MEEIEKTIEEDTDSPASDDIGTKMKKNPNEVKKAMKKLDDKKNKGKKGKGKDGKPECPKEPEEKDKVHVVMNKEMESITLKSNAAYSPVDSLLIEDDLKEEHLSIVFYTIAGEFDISEEDDKEGEAPHISTKLIIDDVE
jgi:hypothetical protein